MMNIEETIIKVIENKITGDQLLYLQLISDNKIDLAENFINYCYYGKDQIESLILKGYLSDFKTLSDRGEELLSEFDFNVVETVPEGVEGWIDEYREKFKNISVRNRPLTGNRIDCISKMKKFMTKYKYDKDTVLKATDNYIDRMRSNINYIQSADYFILKHTTSNLASECEALKEGYSPDTKFEDTTKFIV